jgi:release factor glutamine methyltransferase
MKKRSSMPSEDALMSDRPKPGPDPRPSGAGAPPPPPSSAPPGPGERWTILRLILWSAEYLTGRGVTQARLDAEHLLARALRQPRLQLYLQHERPVDAEELAAFKPLLQRRAAREPLQHIVGSAPFRELDLLIDARALIPRPETEVLVGAVLEWAREREPGVEKTLTAADIGTGTGCIALSLALEGPFRRVVGTDVSDAALELAAANAQRSGLEATVDLRRGSLFEPLADERFDALVSNPPYVAVGEGRDLDPEVKDFEPAQALFAGPDGLAVIAPLVAGASRHLRDGGLLALEVGAGQASSVVELISATGAFGPARVRRDLAGRPRIVTAARAS